MGASLHQIIATAGVLSSTPPTDSRTPPLAGSSLSADPGERRMADIRTLDQIQPTDGDAVGGKGLSLGRLVRAGLPVPPGFCITSAAHRRLRGQVSHSDEILATAIVAAYHQLGGGPVAVRSSATAEDGTVFSFAGQQETILGVSGDDELLAAVARCWQS